MVNRILVIDDEVDFLDTIQRGLKISGFKNVYLESDSKKAASLIRQEEPFDLVLIDLAMPGLGGIELLEIIKQTSPNTECIMVTAMDEAKSAVECLKKGAYDYLVKPIMKEDLIMVIDRALERRRLLNILDLGKQKVLPKLLHKEAFEPIVTGSQTVFRILKEAELHAESDIPILITGESGTGKELLARAIHKASFRSKYHFTPVNMASLTSSLFEAEFFGHTKGAFTGAEKDRIGYLEHTNRGSMFLDEIGRLPLELQGKLLRVLQEGEYIKLGTNQAIFVDVRFISATNVDLDQMMAKGGFRKDLYYRLKGAWLHLPALKERKEDIPLLINSFLEALKHRHGDIEIDEYALAALMDYDYPGNIRELKSIVQSAANLAHDNVITKNTLPDGLKKRTPKVKVAARIESNAIIPLAQVEKEHILNAYQKIKNKTQTANLLGIGLNTLRRKLKTYKAE